MLIVNFFNRTLDVGFLVSRVDEDYSILNILPFLFFSLSNVGNIVVDQVSQLHTSLPAPGGCVYARELLSY